MPAPPAVDRAVCEVRKQFLRVPLESVTRHGRSTYYSTLHTSSCPVTIIGSLLGPARRRAVMRA